MATGDNQTDSTATPVAPDEGFLHSLATSIGIDPEAVKQAAKAIQANPVQAAKDIGGAQVDEFIDAATHPLKTAKLALQGVASTLTNPDAKATALARLKSPGIMNKLVGGEEYATSAIPFVGGGLAKSEEQAAQGNVSGSMGTLAGTVAPLVTETEPVEGLKTHIAETGKNLVESAKGEIQKATTATAPEGSLEAGFAKIGGKKIRSAPKPEPPAAEETQPESVLEQAISNTESQKTPAETLNKAISKTEEESPLDKAIKQTETTAPQGGHAGGGVASVEELNRPGRFVKIKSNGEYTDQGKTPDFTLAKGEAGYQVKPDGTYELKDGQESATTRAGVEKYIKNTIPSAKAPAKVNFGETGHRISAPVEEEEPNVYELHDESEPETKYHPDLQKVADKYSVTDSPDKLDRGASFITPDGKFIHLPAGMVHPDAIEAATGERAVEDKVALGNAVNKENKPQDSRIRFLKDTGAIRTRFNPKGPGGPTMHISLPPQGVTEEEIPAVRQAVAAAGKNGNVVMERVDVTPKTKDDLIMTQEFPREEDTEKYLRKVHAHPDQHTATTPEVSPNPKLQESAQKYAKAQGMSEINHTPVQVDPERAKEIAKIYHEAQHSPNDPRVKAAYDALKSETKAQFHHLRDDLGLKFEPQAEDPYNSAGEMMNDIKQNNRLKVFTGSSTGPDHPLSDIDPETGESHNTLFRWVHDAMGHAAGGNDFSENGEKSATEAHAQMYSAKARPAMRAETEGQTSWFFHNPDVESGKAKPGQFAEQKATLLPDEWQPPKGLKEGIPSSKAVDTKIPLSKLSISPSAYSGASSDIARGRGSKTAGPVRIVYNPDNGQYLVEDGMHRIVEAHKKGETEIPAKLWSGSSDVADVHGEKMDMSPEEWHERAGDQAATEEAGGIDPRTGKSDTTGVGAEILPELRQPLDHAPTAEDFKNFYNQHREIFDKYPELRVGWDNNSAVPGGHEINVGAVGPDAARVAKKMDQKSAFNIAKGEIIPTGGSGLRTEFPNYSIEDRIKDLRGEAPSTRPGFEHLSDKIYNSLEPDERDYLKGDKLAQRNVMAQYHKITPSVEETTNAMQAGAALAGWWKRYINIFHGLVGDDKAIGVKPEGKLLYHYTTKPFDQFDPMIGGAQGDFGTHLGTKEQAHGRMAGASQSQMVGEDIGSHIRPVYADIKNPVRVEDHGDFAPLHIASQLKDRGLLSRDEYNALANTAGSDRPEALRDLLEHKGYDSLVYLNRVEGSPIAHTDLVTKLDLSDAQILKRYPRLKGNDSYIVLRPEQINPKYSAETIANTIGPSHAEVLKQWHAALSATKSVEDANNLAWHSYADWLDAGKPTDRKSIDDIIRKNGAQAPGSGKKGNAALSDTRNKKGKILSEGVDTSKIFNLVNSPEMQGKRPFSGDVFRDDQKNPLMGKSEGYRKVPSMGATVAGKGNLNRLVIDTHIRAYFGMGERSTAAQYIAASAHLREAAKALGLKGGEGQEQLWGTVLGLKTLLKEGLTPDDVGGRLTDTIRQIGKDYAEIIANDPEISKPGGLLDRIKQKYGIGRGSAGVSEAYRKTLSSSPSEGGPGSSQTPVDQTLLGKTAGRVRSTIAESKIKKPESAEQEGDTSFNFGANVQEPPEPPSPTKKAPRIKGAISSSDFIKMLGRLKKPAK